MKHIKPIYELFDKSSQYMIKDIVKHHIPIDNQFSIEYLIELNNDLYKFNYKYLDKMLSFDFSIVNNGKSDYYTLTNKFNLYDILSVSSKLFEEFKANADKTGENYIVETLLFDPIKEKDETDVSPLNTKRGKVYDYYVRTKLKKQDIHFEFSSNNIELIYDLTTPIFLKDLIL
jgi:predicted transcriptional regulator